MNPPAAIARHTAAASAKSNIIRSSGLELREGCCGQFLPTAETHPPARTLLVIRTGTSVAELKVPAVARKLSSLNLSDGLIVVNTRNPKPEHLGSQPTRKAQL